jgi:hypothetical protein
MKGKKGKLLACGQRFSRYIAAKRLLGQIVAGHGIGPGPAAPADIDELASSAVVLVTLEVPQFMKKG